MGTLNVNLLGTSFSFQAEEDSEYLEKMLSYYSRVVNSIEEAKILKTPLQVSILAGLMLCDEVKKAKDSSIKSEKKLVDYKRSVDNSAYEQESNEVEQRTLSMIEKISKVMDENQNLD